MLFDNPYRPPLPSFIIPVDPPGVDPDEDATAGVCFNPAYRPYILGALKQLQLPTTWNFISSDQAQITNYRIGLLIGMFMHDSACVNVPNWYPYSVPTGQEAILADQRGQGLNGPFWVRCAYAIHAHWKFKEYVLGNYVGGLVNVLNTNEPTLTVQQNIRVVDCANITHTWSNVYGPFNIIQQLGGPTELKEIEITCDGWVPVTMVIKNNYTCA